MGRGFLAVPARVVLAVMEVLVEPMAPMLVAVKEARAVHTVVAVAVRVHWYKLMLEVVAQSAFFGPELPEHSRQLALVTYDANPIY